MDIYRVSSEYIERLREIDTGVLLNKPEGKQRPYCGAITSINERTYFVPMSSPKEKSSSSQISIKILDEDEELLGTLKFNNMIPVPKSELTQLDINKIRKYEDPQYGNLLMKQYFFLKGNEERIEEKAVKVYRNRGNCVPFFEKVCCDFKALEAEHDKLTR